MLSKIGKWYSEVFLYKGSKWLSILARLGILTAMLVNFYMVIIRKLFPALGLNIAGGIIGAYEITQLAMIVTTGCACAYTWYTGGHIRVGLFRDGMKERRRAFWDAVIAVLGASWVGIIVWAVFNQGKNFATLGVGTPLNRIPLAPFAFVFSGVMAFVFLVLTRSSIGLVSKAMGKKFARESYLQEQ